MRLAILLVIALAVYAAWKTFQAYRYRRRLSASDPLRLLSRREQRAWAREQLKREQDAYNDARTNQIVNSLKENQTL
ncbi:Uncharacterised protein [Mycobacteroides abscessus subsp. abscessus]|nr:Uncharacterised protein [Mycobacteroides abscessus subsp. abscessus]